jgi:hypothetical protein
MATTTNYGWTTPNDTDLVKDGASAIRTLGSSIDTTTKALNPSTTLGDIEYRSATANTNTRLGIGTSGQVLSVNGSGIPAWTTPSAGATPALTLVKTQTIGTTVSSVSVSDAFSSTYDNYLITITGGSASTLQDMSMRLGSTSSGYYWAYTYAYYDGSAAGKSNGNGVAQWQICTYDSSDTDTQIIVQSPYLSRKTSYQSRSNFGGATSNPLGYLNDSNSYTAFTLYAGGGTLTGGVIRVYGYQNS